MSSPTEPPRFLLESLGDTETSTDNMNITLTYAQSLDGKIAGAEGKQLILSGNESMVMTHWMRTMHDAILVGIGTALNDDPQLNTRHLPPRNDGVSHALPQPVILDTHLRLPLSCKLLKNHAAGTGKQPWLITRSPPGKSYEIEQWNSRRHALEEAGARVLVVDDGSTGQISIERIVGALYKEGIRSLMVEGGARVIESFLAHPSVVSRVVVTIAPVFVGQSGVGYATLSQVPLMEVINTQTFGRDIVTALRFVKV